VPALRWATTSLRVADAITLHQQRCDAHGNGDDEGDRKHGGPHGLFLLSWPKLELKNLDLT
jgi:hypothetical protein